MTQKGHKTAAKRASEPELDEALARAIRLLISGAIESGATTESGAAVESGTTRARASAA